MRRLDPAVQERIEGMTFEDAMKRLEEIVKKMEGLEMGLDESLLLFEEGIHLSRICSRRLDEAEHRLEQLVEGGDGKGEIVPVEEPGK